MDKSSELIEIKFSPYGKVVRRKSEPTPEPKTDALAEYYKAVQERQFGGCAGCGSEERVRY